MAQNFSAHRWLLSEAPRKEVGKVRGFNSVAHRLKVVGGGVAISTRFCWTLDEKAAGTWSDRYVKQRILKLLESGKV